jgi:2-dehydropantoate 2-reductase
MNRNKTHVEALKRRGARITGAIDMTVTVTALTPDEIAGEHEYHPVLTKQLLN